MDRPTHGGRVDDFAAIVALALIMMWAAVLNGFPLIFPDTGTYFGIAYGHEYAIDRSSFYGLLLKPVLAPFPGQAGLWLGIFLQCLAVAGVIGILARRIVPDISLTRMLPWLAALALTTSVAWHAGQYMPDAFTGILVLTGWLAATRDPADAGAPTLWMATIVMAMIHYTHVPLLLAVTFATILSAPADVSRLRSAVRRGSAALVSVGVAAAMLVVANGAALGRWSPTPLGSAFLFARLTEDGLTKPWLRDNCSKTAPPELCEIQVELPDDSQLILWSGASPYASRVWYPRSDSERWAWIDMLSTANYGSITARPLTFLATAGSHSVDQFISFQAIDDLCPTSCGNPVSGPVHELITYRPGAVASLQASRQLQNITPRTQFRMLSTPVAIIALLFLPILSWMAIRRRDTTVQSLLTATTIALMTNAVVAGALSAVHDRYQSRIIWIVPLVVLLTLLRWRHTFSRSRISLPGLK